MKKNAQRFGREYRYDIALDEGVGPWMVMWISGLMVFFVTMALACNFALSALTQNWVGALAGSVTVEIPVSALDEKDTPKIVKQITSLADQHPAVSAARRMEDAEVRGLVEPWLGDNLPKDLALPILIEMELAPGADVGKLAADIKALAPAAAVDTHGELLGDVRTLANTARFFVLLLTGVIVALAVVSVAGIVRAKFSIHRQEVETLHYIGAADEYIARQFRLYMLKSTLKGAVAGLLCMAVVLLAIGWMTGTVNEALLPRLDIMPLEWLFILVLPVIIGSLIAHLTAQRAVMNELAKMP